MSGKRQNDPTYRLLRRYLLVAIPLLLLMATRPDDLHFTFLQNIDLINLSAWGVGIALTILILWKAGRERRR